MSPFRYRSGSTLATALCLATVFASGAYARNALGTERWPTWRGPSQDGVSTTSQIPLSWSPTNNVRWKTALPGNGTSSPVVWDQRVFLTATSGRDHTELHVLAFDLESGKKVWERRMTGHATALFTQFPPARGHAMPSPVTDGEYLVTLFSTGELAAFSLAGEPLWFRSLQEEFGEIDNDYGLSASPAIAGTGVLLQIDHARGSYLTNIDLETGRTTWKVERAGAAESWASPVVVPAGGESIVVCAGSGKLRGYELATGKEVWQSDDLARLCCPTPIPVGDRLVVTSGPGGNVQCLRLGKGVNDVPAREWRTPKGSGFVPSGIVVDGRYYYASERGIVTCLDLARGEEVWAQRLGGSFRGSPVADGRHIVFTSLEGKSTVIEAGAQYRVVGEGELGEPVSASPAMVSDGLLFRTEGHLVRIAPTSQQPK